MINLAGKYINQISRNPIASAVAGGLGAAGLATLGNVVSGEGREEGPGRLGLEALGAGALGAAFGAQIPGLRGRAVNALRNLDAVSSTGAGAAARKAKMTPEEIAHSEGIRNLLQRSVAAGADPTKVKNQLNTGLRPAQTLINTAAIPIGLTVAGGLGGMIGGGVANAGKFVGIPGLTQDQAMQMAAQQAIDPESYGSSNSIGARHKAATLSPQYM